MSKFDGVWSSRFWVAFLLTVVTFGSATRAQVGASPSPQARKRMVRAVDKTLQEGLHVAHQCLLRAREGYWAVLRAR